MPMRTVAHRGRQTAFRHRGGDESGAIVFVHGAGASHAVWRPQLHLSDRLPVAAVDLSGHGDSGDVAADPGWETLSAYASDIEAVAEAVDARFIVGHSLGAATSLHLVATRDLPIAGVVAIGTGPRLPVHAEILRMAEDDFEGLVSFLHGPDRLFHDPEDPAVDASREAMRACGAAVTRRDFLTSNAIDLRSDLPLVDVPVLALCGAEDRITPVHVHERLVERLSEARLAVIEDAAHVVMLERPEAVNEEIRRFVDEVEGNGS